MSKMNRFKIALCIIGFMSFTLKTLGQQVTVKPFLTEDALEVINRKIIISKNEQNKPIVKVNAQPNAGIIWVKDIVFKKGIIEFDVKGKDVLQESFVGIAFHGQCDSIYEAVYFRPFNFQAVDSIRKKHAIQYIATPGYDWPYLRESFPDQYESSLSISVDPNDWFHVKIIVDDKTIKTFVNEETKPSLIVHSLQSSTSGKIGFWTGNDSDGQFANLVITNQKD